MTRGWHLHKRFSASGRERNAGKDLLTKNGSDAVKLSVRRMCKADLLAVAQLEKECFAEAWSENALTESLAEANYVFFVAVVSKPSCMADEKDTEEIAGYVGAYLAADELSITNVAVFSSYRRCGAANQLMKALDAFAQEKNLYGITLEVRVSNNAAIALYEKNGYEKSGIRKGFYSKPKEDALIMWKYFQ